MDIVVILYGENVQMVIEREPSHSIANAGRDKRTESMKNEEETKVFNLPLYKE